MLRALQWKEEEKTREYIVLIYIFFIGVLPKSTHNTHNVPENIIPKRTNRETFTLQVHIKSMTYLSTHATICEIIKT